MAYRSKQPHPLNFSALNLALKDKIDNPLQLLASRRRRNSHIPAQPVPSQSIITPAEGTSSHSGTSNSANPIQLHVQEVQTNNCEANGVIKSQVSAPPLKLESNHEAHSLISRRRQKLHSAKRGLSVDPTILIYPHSSFSSLLASVAPVSSPSSYDPSPTVPFPAKANHHHDLEANGIYSPTGSSKSKPPTTSYPQNHFIHTPAASEANPSHSNSPGPHSIRHPTLSTSSTATRPSPLSNSSPQKFTQETTINPAIASPSWHPNPHSSPLSLSHTKQRKYTVPSNLPDVREKTGSISSLSSLHSSSSSADHHMPLASPALVNPWPVPPSSTNSHFPSTSGWPKKSATYYPLRTWSYAPRPDPSVLIPPLQRPPATLAYLDLSSAPMSHRSANSPTILATQSIGINGDESSKTRNRPISTSSQQSSASKETYYEDAPDKAEWMEVDSGDAYDDLDKTENTVRKMSQRVSLLNSVEAVNLAAEARTRYHAMSESGKSQDLTAAFLHMIPGARAIHTPVNYLHHSISSQSTDPSTNSPDRNSYASSKTASSTFSHQSAVSSEHERISPRSGTGIDRMSIGGVPLFTRTSNSFREDKEDEKEKELEPIPEAPDLERAEEFYRMTGSPSIMGGNSARRRLKPLILRTTPSNAPYTRKRFTGAESSLRHSQSLDSVMTPPQPIYEPQSSSVAANHDSWNANQQTSHDDILKDSETTLCVAESGKESLPSSMGGNKKGSSVEMDKDPSPQPNQDPPQETATQDETIHLFAKKLLEPPEAAAASEEPAKQELAAPVTKLPKPRSGTFGVHSTKPVWAVPSNPSINIISRESLVLLAIEDSSSSAPFPAELQKNVADHIGIYEAATTVQAEHAVIRKASLKNLSPLKTHLLTTPVRQRASSHHSSIRTGVSEEVSIATTTTTTLKADSPPTSKQTSPVGFRKRCLSTLCLSRTVQNQDRGVSAASYAAAQLANKKSMQQASVASGAPNRRDTLIISAGGAPSSSSETPTPTDETALWELKAPSSSPHQGKHPGDVPGSGKKNRLFLTLSRLQSRDVKVIDLAKSSSRTPVGPNDVLPSPGTPRLIRGKLTRISRPVLLQGDDERSALWRMISHGKLASSGHHHK
ncbi:hypothetical protein PCANC_27381 [Puccinia coronata f. sp. avenae]|uniref:Uncharacterized protein n=1 Tax=Puccinia coronata f. sp. avenae TaxID=200324 RepID=A0A2N5SAG5_9BASI|nr:hypothetical protein PCANC_27381 [Puccinia coronata f. sp. avenae]